MWLLECWAGFGIYSTSLFVVSRVRFYPLQLDKMPRANPAQCLLVALA